jgi:hypothetical protein
MVRRRLHRHRGRHHPDDDGPPDLQTLVYVYRGYEKIPPEAWDEFDRAMKAWQTQRREKYRRR